MTVFLILFLVMRLASMVAFNGGSWMFMDEVIPVWSCSVVMK
jgi:hypothetical protein